jgi:hypothetical protein
MFRQIIDKVHKLWNSLDKELKLCENVGHFKRLLRRKIYNDFLTL